MKAYTRRTFLTLSAAALALGALTACGRPSQEDTAMLQSMGASADIKNSALLNAKAAAQIKAMKIWLVTAINADEGFALTEEEAIAALNDYANMYNPWDESDYATKTTYASGGGLTEQNAASAMTGHYPKIGAGKRSYGIAYDTVTIKGRTFHVVMAVFDN